MAYRSAVYLRATTVSGETVVKLVMSKTRIAPVRRVTVPRLKLMAALITARLISFMKTSLEMKFSKVVCWTDSQIALRWIQGDSYRWKPFVGNRVESILELTDAQWWRHCPTTDNPADILTRGCRMKDLVSNNLWWHGPHWLTKCEDAWPTAKLELAIDRNPEFQAEVRKSARELHTQTKSEPVLDPQKYSSLMKLFNVTAYVFCFIMNCKAVPEERKTTPLDEDLESLKQEKKLPKSSRLWPLNPYVDDNGLLRVGGHLRHSDLPFHTKYPVLLPNQHPLVRLLVRDEHIRHLHAGVNQTLSCLRQRYWIINGRSVVKRVIKECVTCRKENAKPFSPKMSNLLRERVVKEGVYLPLYVYDNASNPFGVGIQPDCPTVNIEEDRMEVHNTSSAMMWRVLGTFGSVWEDSAEEGRASPDAPYDPNHHGQTTDTVGRLTKRWRYKKKRIAHFWIRWRSKYIVLFCTRSKWRGGGTEPKVGDVILIAEADVNKGRWMMGRVLELFHGRDEVVRSVRLKE
ncbi:hypothetical protein T4D_7354 [Trichinella pseudospiralis]|uniref:Integrase zinc-binding domain-containing protein n=1 Tax=Trichinella pseudospiralis TaxID=6337 RepID=A0A0V1FV61_TRIPS|nr:hypothetical protein T4D_2326 [Trichinella pseudospiralis]KRY89858.1 hypothetical protein T4D_7354 [Trichinella pseudospiralis]